ncbi:DNA damage-binding protein cmr1-like [Bidens hawaiensis]|uniref:DNA damage-binding protein cmr1-like n=1 Tax=Bidens hawaiensis TaxID=980011 RepID=UPI00404A1AAF
MNSLFIGEEFGSLGSLDIRTSKPNSSWDLHQEKIYTIDFNSQNTNLMATSSKDKTACIWDLRKLDHLNPRPLKLVKHNGGVNSAYFSPSGNSLATTSRDDNIGLMSGANYDVQSMINHSNNTPTFISSFRGIWGWDDGFIMVGNKKLKGVDVICVGERKLAYTMTNREINAIPCRFDAHPILPGVLATSTAGGRVYVWDI